MPANIINTFPSIQQMTDKIGRQKETKSQEAFKIQGRYFEEILNSRVSEDAGLKFSKHANMRMQSRSIDLSEDQRTRLENGAQKAGAKGIRESLVMVDDLAFIVNTSNKTVITAIGEGEDKIFTNIDGAVIA
ncbi:MAG: flagellar protein [Lachnospiraceae bacterium]|nr:flagellar protein [Lachnospiraceae bacterium]